MTGAAVTTIESGANSGNTGTNPASGTDAYDVFSDYVHFGSGSDSIELPGSASYTYSFSGLAVGNTYDFTGTAVRGNNSYTNRWTLVTLNGADSFSTAHSTGNGIVTTGLPATPEQAAMMVSSPIRTLCAI